MKRKLFIINVFLVLIIIMNLPSSGIQDDNKNIEPVISETEETISTTNLSSDIDNQLISDYEN